VKIQSEHKVFAVVVFCDASLFPACSAKLAILHYSEHELISIWQWNVLEFLCNLRKNIDDLPCPC
jgi:hypothetical protein